MDKKRYIMPLVSIMDMRGERLMATADGSGLDHGVYGLMPARERIVTSAY